MFRKKAPPQDQKKSDDEANELVLALCLAVGGLCEAIARQSGADPAKVVADFRETLAGPDQPKNQPGIARAVEGGFLLAAKQAELQSLRNEQAKTR